MTKTRQKILKYINEQAGFRLLNVQNGTGSAADKAILDEALGFRSICLFSGLADKELQKLWDESNLKYSL